MVAAVAALLAIPGAAQAASSPSVAPDAVYYDGRPFTAAEHLRRYVIRRGGSWEGLLDRQPAVVRAFGLRAVHVHRRSFYSRAAVARRLRQNGVRYARWARQHPLRARRLRLNARAKIRPPKTVAPAPQPAPQPSAAVSTRIGVSLDNPEYKPADVRDRELDEVAAAGAGWVRFDVKWSDVQWHGADSFDWRKYDPLVDAARARGLSVLGNLAYSPTWARDAGTSDKFAPDTDARRAAFARFAAAAAARYRGRVAHWEIWNETNSPIFWRPAPNPSSYAALLASAYPAIKQADPGALVLAGATAPASTGGGWIDEVAFLQGVYAAGGGQFFDAWSHHPYDFVLGPGGQHPDSAWHQMFGTSPSIRSVMTANGDAVKRVWATESGAPSAGSVGSLVFTEELQADHVRRSHQHWLTYDWAGVIFTYTGRDLAAPGQGDYWSYLGLLRADFSRKPAWSAFRASTL